MKRIESKEERLPLNTLNTYPLKEERLPLNTYPTGIFIFLFPVNNQVGTYETLIGLCQRYHKKVLLPIFLYNNDMRI